MEDFLAPNGRIGDGKTGKNPMLYVIEGFSTAHRFQNGSTSRNPHLDSAMDAPGWGFSYT